MTFTYTNGGDYELVSVDELTRLRMAALQLESVKANRDMWRERALDMENEPDMPPADDCRDSEDCPECGGDPCYRDWPEDPSARSDSTNLTMHFGAQRPHESLVWATFLSAVVCAYKTNQLSPLVSSENLTAQADRMLSWWRSRWPEDEAA